MGRIDPRIELIPRARRIGVVIQVVSWPIRRPWSKCNVWIRLMLRPVAPVLVPWGHPIVDELRSGANFWPAGRVLCGQVLTQHCRV